jgi:ADP-ribose pyrophosphatase YjhB (NUDIX family)
MILASFPIKVYFGNDFQIVENERELAVLLEEYTYVRAAGGIVRNAEGQILMIFRRGVWDFPKGKAEQGETIEETAVREVLEETGIQARIANARSFSVFHTYDTYGPKMLKETVWYEMEAVAGSVKPQTEEQIAQAVWVERDKVAELLKDSYASLREAWGNFLK